MPPLDTTVVFFLVLVALAASVLGIYYKMDAPWLRADKRDLLDTLGAVRAENTRLKRERAIIRPPTQAEFAILARRHCGTCAGSGFDRDRREPCSCTNAKVNARIESGDMTLRDGRPWIVERLVSEQT